MNIFDAHCDVLMKMFMDPEISFINSSKIDITYNAISETGGKVQCFAIYIPENIHPDMRFMVALTMVEIFYEKILTIPGMKLIQRKADIDHLKVGEIGAILTLEGCDCIGSDLIKLKTFLRLGVKSVGLTWNFANILADGAMEKRGAGLTYWGKQVIRILNECHVWTDVSHLSERAFWDVMERADRPIASHSNAYQLCPHPRNLRDEQIKALISKKGTIGVTFVPDFLKTNKQAKIKDVLKHIDYICSLGGENHIGFGSDFDGIDSKVEGLSNYWDYSQLVNTLEKHYSSTFVKKITYSNFATNFPL